METKLEMIAIFMGGLWNVHSNKFGIGNSSYCDYNEKKNVVRALNHYTINELKYHTSWNWLIPVVSKILIGSYTMEGVKKMKEVQNSLITCSIEKTFESVCKFIEWYNAS